MGGFICAGFHFPFLKVPAWSLATPDAYNKYKTHHPLHTPGARVCDMA